MNSPCSGYNEYFMCSIILKTDLTHAMVNEYDVWVAYLRRTSFGFEIQSFLSAEVVSFAHDVNPMDKPLEIKS